MYYPSIMLRIGCPFNFLEKSFVTLNHLFNTLNKKEIEGKYDRWIML